jgi:hypothetical protein
VIPADCDTLGGPTMTLWAGTCLGPYEVVELLGPFPGWKDVPTW